LFHTNYTNFTIGKTERVREDASGDSEDGEDDELPCVIGESAGDCTKNTAKMYGKMINYPKE